jgi:uncharacterized protein DUF6010
MAAPATANPPLRSHAAGMAIGLAGGLVSTGFSALWDERDALAYNAMLLTGISWVYLGFAIADGRRSSIGVQIASALVCLNLAFFGYRWDSRLVVGLGFIAHGVWDWLHHNHRGPTEVRTYYPPFCAVADIVIGIPLLARWV